MSKSFYRKVGFGLGKNDEVPADPFNCATNQLNEIPNLLWSGWIPSEKEMRTKYGEWVCGDLGDAFNNTLIITLTEFGRTIKQNGGYGTEHRYGSAVLMAGGLLKKSQVYIDWPCLKRKELFEGRDLHSTIDERAVYNSAMAVCFNKDPEF